MAPAGVSIALALASSLASTRASLIAPQPAQRPSPAQTKRERALLLQRKADIAALQAERYALQAQALRLERELERVEERQEEERHIEPSPLDPIQLSLLDPSDGSEESIEESPVHRFSQVSIETEEEYLKVWWELGMPSFGFPTRPLDAPTIESLVEDVFGMDSFFVHSVRVTPAGTLFYGALRRTDVSLVSKLVQTRLHSHPTLAQQIQLFMLRDPLGELDLRSHADSLEDDDDIFEPLDPVFLALPVDIIAGRDAVDERNDGVEQENQLMERWSRLSSNQLFLPLAFVVGTNLATADFAYTCFRATDGDVSAVGQVLPMTLGVFAIQLAHELGHGIAAKAHGVKLNLPFLIPSPLAGCIGGHTQLSSSPANSTALFDVALAGPVAGYAASITAAVAGLIATVTSSPQ
ncbi:MAG: hypothetical protein SGPRY_004991, partial [Prymnesium sp.]